MQPLPWLKYIYQSLCHHTKWIHKRVAIFNTSSNHPQYTNPSPSFFHQDINQGFFFFALFWMVDVWWMKAVWGSNRSSQLRHLPLIIIHNYPWYIPPLTGITQPKSSIHLVNDREWAERWRAWRAAAGWIWVCLFWATAQHLHTTTLLQVRYQLRPTEENPLRVSSLRAWTMDGLLLSVTVESYGQGYFK